jgi:hypothetical protein
MNVSIPKLFNIIILYIRTNTTETFLQQGTPWLRSILKYMKHPVNMEPEYSWPSSKEPTFGHYII